MSLFCVSMIFIIGQSVRNEPQEHAMLARDGGRSPIRVCVKQLNREALAIILLTMRPLN